MKSIQDFVKENGMAMKAERVSDNPNMGDSRDMDNWKVVLRAGRSRMTTYFSMGRGHGGKEPEIADVLDCLASDAAGVENARSFEDWAAEYGYDTDSRKAEKTYKAIEKQSARLAAFLGESAYEILLWNTEKL